MTGHFVSFFSFCACTNFLVEIIKDVGQYEHFTSGHKPQNVTKKSKTAQYFAAKVDTKGET